MGDKYVFREKVDCWKENKVWIRNKQLCFRIWIF